MLRKGQHHPPSPPIYITNKNRSVTLMEAVYNWVYSKGRETYNLACLDRTGGETGGQKRSHI